MVKVTIKGYQQYEIVTGETIRLIPLEPRTRSKFDIVKDYLTGDQIKEQTVLDLGAAEGFFGLSALVAGAKKVYLQDHWGKDEFHPDEARVKHALTAIEPTHPNVELIKCKVSECDQHADVVLAFALIHWIYAYTDKFNGLSSAIKYLADITDSTLIIEWIGLDDKAMKVRDQLCENNNETKGDYNHEVFIQSLESNFKDVKKLNSYSSWDNSVRDIYVATK
jgi:hypothetical protein